MDRDQLLRAAAAFAALRDVFTEAAGPAAPLPAPPTPVPQPPAPAPPPSSDAAVDIIEDALKRGSSRLGAAAAKPAAAPAPAPAPVAPPTPSSGRRIGSVGVMPNTAVPLELRPNDDGTVTPFSGKYPMVDFESGEPISPPADVTPEQAFAAIRSAGSIGEKTRLFGLKQDGALPTPAPTPKATPEPEPVTASAPVASAPSAPSPSPSPARQDAAQLVALRKRMSVLNSIKECLTAGARA